MHMTDSLHSQRSPHLFRSPGWPEVRLPSWPVLCHEQLPPLPALWAVQHCLYTPAGPVRLSCEPGILQTKSSNSKPASISPHQRRCCSARLTPVHVTSARMNPAVAQQEHSSSMGCRYDSTINDKAHHLVGATPSAVHQTTIGIQGFPGKFHTFQMTAT